MAGGDYTQDMGGPERQEEGAYYGEGNEEMGPEEVGQEGLPQEGEQEVAWSEARDEWQEVADENGNNYYYNLKYVYAVEMRGKC